MRQAVKGDLKLRKEKPLKRPPGQPINLASKPSPLPKSMAGFGKSWIGDMLYDYSNEVFISKAALDFLKERGR